MFFTLIAKCQRLVRLTWGFEDWVLRGFPASDSRRTAHWDVSLQLKTCDLPPILTSRNYYLDCVSSMIINETFSRRAIRRCCSNLRYAGFNMFLKNYY